MSQSNAEAMAASLESGQESDEKFMGGTGGNSDFSTFTRL